MGTTTLNGTQAARAARSRAGPAAPGERLALPPELAMPRIVQVARFSRRQIQFVFAARREAGEVFFMRAGIGDGTVIVCDPEHVRSLFTADPALVPSLTAESPLRPIVGPASVLTANGDAHMRQRKLLLPPFHGEAVARYEQMIERVTERELDSWPLQRPFALAARMQALTLEVIMSGIFGVDGRPASGTPADRLRRVVKRLAFLSASPVGVIGEAMNLGRMEPVGLTKIFLPQLDRAIFAVLAQRRGEEDLAARGDILSLLLAVRDEEGQALSDSELRDELVTLVLAGFETTANSLAWTWERLLRTPPAHQELVAAVRERREDGGDVVEWTILEGMRSRPVIPIIGRRVAVPWRLGEYVVPAGTAVSVSILLLHHREDLYPEPFAFLPRRWQDRKPGTYEWIPFGGGTRRCLGAALAMAEQRIVLTQMARRLDLEADRPAPERAQHRNVTMIPARGARAVVRARD